MSEGRTSRIEHEDVIRMNRLLEEVRPIARHGRVASYIPELASAEPLRLGFTVVDLKGDEITVGDCSTRFTLQSISKVFTLALALADVGAERVFSKVGMEPTGDPFNSIIKLETRAPGKPLNPMINAGAIAVTSLIQGRDNGERLERLLQLVRQMSGNSQIGINNLVFQSEKETGHRNRAMAFLMKDYGVLEGDVEEILELYFLQCSIEGTCRDLAHLGACLANGGRSLQTGEPLISLEVAKTVLTFMVTCGMYNASGQFAIRVGIPAKSGVSGGIMAAVPRRLGIGVIGPALDEKGNSLAGTALLEACAKMWNLSIFQGISD